MHVQVGRLVSSRMGARLLRRDLPPGPDRHTYTATSDSAKVGIRLRARWRNPTHTCSVHGKMQVAMFSIVIVDKGLQDCAARRVCFSTRRSYAAMGLCAFHPSGPCLDARSHMIAGCLESPRPGGIPAQIPARPSYWAGSSQPIFRIFSVKQRRPVDAPRLHRRHPLC
jgi:hypothetical protein